jgi:hypothetical protein
VVIGRLSTPLSMGSPGLSTPFHSEPAAPPAPVPVPERLPTPFAAPLPTPAQPAPRVTEAEEPDPFAGLSLTDRSGLAAKAVAAAIAAAQSQKKTPQHVERLPTPTPLPITRPVVEEAPPSPKRELVASVLTGVVLAALVLAVLFVASFSPGLAPSWLSFGAPSDIVATRIRSGVYDTATGKPVFFVRGRVENHGKTVRGSVRVIAELVGRGGPDARAESVAGVEPSAEDVYALRSGGDADKLARALSASEGDKRIQPGGSLPFFAVIAEPPADLAGHKLVVRLEPLESPGAPRSAEGPR